MYIYATYMKNTQIDHIDIKQMKKKQNKITTSK